MPKKKSTKSKRKLPAKTIKYLEKAGIKHELLEHKTVYTALDAAITLKKKTDQIAKSLLVKADKDYYVVILPASHNLDLKKLKKVVSKADKKDIKVIKIPNEKIAREVLKIKKDAMAAFGAMHKLPVIMENKLAKAKQVVFSSNSYNHSVEMSAKDFITLENVLLGSFGIKKKVKKPILSKKKIVKKKRVVKK